jgi:hypothetical protein
MFIGTLNVREYVLPKPLWTSTTVIFMVTGARISKSHTLRNMLICLWFILRLFQYLRRRIVGWLANNELESIWKEVKEKRKVKSLCLINEALYHYNIWGSGGIAPPFLTSTLVGSEWSASCPSACTPGETAPVTHWIGGWLGPRASLDTVEQGKKLLPLQEKYPGHPALSSLLYRPTYPGSWEEALVV